MSVHSCSFFLQVAVAGNPDVYKKEVSFWGWDNPDGDGLITHDFWGNDMLQKKRGGYGWTHHSWRPLIVLSFRWDHAMGGGSPWPFHLSNVLYHALSALAAYVTYRCLFPPTPAAPSSSSSSTSKPRIISTRAFLSSLLFALHPVHSECVANITSRADAVASVFQLLAVALYALVSGRIQEEVSKAYQRMREEEQDEKEAGHGSGSGNSAKGWLAIVKGILCPCLRPPTKAETALALAKASASGSSARCLSFQQFLLTAVKLLSSSFLYFLLLLISLACKETSLVVPFLCVCYDIAVAMAKTAVSTRMPPKPASSSSSYLSSSWLRLSGSYLSRLFLYELPWLKAVLVFAFGFAVYWVRIQVVAKGYNLETWANPIHNSLYHTKDKKERVLSIALVQAFALSKLVFPLWLSHEHNAFKHVKGVFEARNTLTIVIWAGLALVVAVALASLWSAMVSIGNSKMRRLLTQQAEGEEKEAAGEAAGENQNHGVQHYRLSLASYHHLARAFAVLFGLAWVAVSYFPSSHAVQYVAFILAERTLYLPSFGACVIIAELLMLIAGHSSDSHSSSSESNGHGGDAPSSSLPSLAADGEAEEDAAASWNDFLTVDTGSASEPSSSSSSSSTHEASSKSPASRSSAAPGAGTPQKKEEKEKRTRFVLGYKIKLPGKTNSASAAYQQKTEQQQQQHGKASTTAAAAASPSTSKAGASSSLFLSSSSSSDDSKRPQSSVLRKLVGSRRRTFSTFFTSLLLCWYVVRTWTRNWDWINEEELMSANLHHYPEGNVMTIYGLGAVALYKGEIDRAEQYLVRACNESTMVEPHILLSQLYWKHRSQERGQVAFDIAISELEHVASTVTPRKEVLTNLGMLLFKKADRNNTEAMKQAEYYILAAQVAHGYPEGHHSIAQLSSNAGCIRLMSTKDRYGDAMHAERLVNEALEVARNSGGTGAAFKNAATFYAVQGYAPLALSILEEGIGYVEEGLRGALESNDPSQWPGGANGTARSNIIQYYQELLYSMQRQLVTVQLHTPLLASWAASGPPVIGDDAEPRMAVLGVDCMLELLWW